MSQPSNQHLLFEVGVEEIPSDYLDGALSCIRRIAPALLAECGYQVGRLDVYATPRRLVIVGQNFSKKEAEMEERLGPSKDQCYQDGVPTPALNGFLKNAGKKESDVHWKETLKGVRVAVFLKKETKPLRFFFETLPRQIEFPKLMRWDASGQVFTRPLRWSFALVGKQPQAYRIGLLPSGQTTQGHRFLANRKVRVTGANFLQYQALLKRLHVILNTEDRVALIRKCLRQAHHHDEGLVRQVANLVEEPFPVLGTFKKDHLRLPAEVLATCMRKHQKIFACYDGKGKLTNRFIAIINGRRSDVKAIARHYENVLESRLEDAKFFYQEDTKTKLEEKVTKLKELRFLGELGSYFDKSERLAKASEFLLSLMPEESLGGKKQTIMEGVRRAALLCKADLVTHLVYEFPELQGIAGSEYAAHDGLPKDVCDSLYQHYLPKNLAEPFDSLRKTVNSLGAMIGLADRIDLLVGAIGLGIEPSSSQDPYALRRAAGGFVKLVRAFRFRFSLAGLVREVVASYGGRLKVKSEIVEQKVVSFIRERIFFELDLKAGTRAHQILQAVLAADADDLTDVFDRYEQLVMLNRADEAVFLKACKVIERTHNILKGASNVPDHINPSLFKHGLEKVLYDVVSAKEALLRGLIQERKYHGATENFGEFFYQPLHDYFETVMVNVEEQDVRENRRALMKKVNQLYTEKVADLSLVTNQ